MQASKEIDDRKGAQEPHQSAFAKITRLKDHILNPIQGGGKLFLYNILKPKYFFIRQEIFG